MAIWKIAKYAGIITVQYNYHVIFFHQQSGQSGFLHETPKKDCHAENPVVPSGPQHCFAPLSMHWWQQQHGSEWIPPQFGSSGFRVAQQQTCESWRIVHVWTNWTNHIFLQYENATSQHPTTAGTKVVFAESKRRESRCHCQDAAHSELSFAARAFWAYLSAEATCTHPWNR